MSGALLNEGRQSLANDNDRALRDRARAVIPGGIWGHMDARKLPANYPQFFVSAEGTRITDCNGRTYLDFMCSYGPMILGYHDEEVDAAAEAQRRKLDVGNGPGEALVELAELLVETIPAADWALFSKNGTDATTTCVTIARAATGKRKILAAQGAYHGAAPWCTPVLGGVTDADRMHVLKYTYNDIASLEAMIAEAGDDLAAILVSAYRHDVRTDQELPTRAFAEAARALADKHDAALILDDVRAGFRLDLGGSWEPLGVQPDLSAWSKALANGYPLSAVTGGDRMREAAQQIFVTGSFWYSPVPMAAACTTIRKLHRLKATATMQRLGQRLRDGVQQQAEALGIGIRQSGPPQMPLMLFDGDQDFRLGNSFCAAALEQGVFLHPWHNMFLSAAHTDADIDEALAATERGLKAVAAEIMKGGQ